MLIYLVRHGETDENAKGIIQGQLDTKLNDQGRRQAELVAKRFKDVSISEIYSSSLSRAFETAKVIVTHHEVLEVKAEPGLMERGLGSMEGRRRFRGEPTPADAESGAVFQQRVYDWFQQFINSHHSALRIAQVEVEEPTILIVSHGAWLGAFLNIVLSKQFNFKPPLKEILRRPCYNTSVMIVRVSVIEPAKDNGRKKFKIEGEILDWGNVDHLEVMHERKIGVVDEVKDGEAEDARPQETTETTVA